MRLAKLDTLLKKRIFPILCFLVLLASGLTWQFWPEPNIGPAHFHRIQLGMSQEVVETAIGMAPGDYSNRGNIYDYFEFLEEKGMPVGDFVRISSDSGGSISTWIGNAFIIDVAFDRSNCSWYVSSS